MDLSLSDASGVPYYRQVRDQIAQRVRSGSLAPGTKLPSVRRLATELRVSVITTRHAYADLESAGLIRTHQGRGTFVADEVAPLDDVAIAEARDGLAAAVARARELGFDDARLRALIEELLR